MLVKNLSKNTTPTAKVQMFQNTLTKLTSVKVGEKQARTFAKSANLFDLYALLRHQ